MGEWLSLRCGHYVGLDYCAESVAAFRARRTKLDIRVGSALDLPFTAAEFDRANMGSVLLCLSWDEAEAALKELRRVTRYRAFVSGNLDATKPLGPAHQRATAFGRAGLEGLSRACGWKRARAVDLPPELPEAGFMFDLILEA